MSSVQCGPITSRRAQDANVTELFPHDRYGVTQSTDSEQDLIVFSDTVSDDEQTQISQQNRYTVSVLSRSKRGTLVDRGANGGIVGNDARVIHTHQRQVDVTGIDNHEINALKIVDASAKVITQHGPAIVILKQYAYHGRGRTIHSAGQIEHYKNVVNDKSMKVGGKQCIRTLDGYLIPLDIINGLPYMQMHPNTDKEWKELPHIILTSGDEWDPTVLDNVISDKEDWYNTLKDLDKGLIKTPFDQYGNYRHRQPVDPVEIAEDTVDPDMPELHWRRGDDSSDDESSDGSVDSDDESEGEPEMNLHDTYDAVSNLNLCYVCFDAEATGTVDDDLGDNYEKKVEIENPEIQKKKVDYETYKPYFLHVPTKKIRKTFENTTQFATNVVSGHNIIQTNKSPFPAHNVRRRNEPVATDTVYAETPAIDSGGMTMAQFYVGRKSLVIDFYGMTNENQFVNTFEDVIRERGAMDVLISDSASVETSQRALDIQRALMIRSWQSEPNYQHQNFAEHRYGHFKGNMEWIMNYRNVDANAWLLCGQWVRDIMNVTAEKSLGWRTPLEVLTGQTQDISHALCFLFWDVVYVARYKDPSYSGQPGSVKSSEIRGRFVGFAHNVGHALTFKILTDDTKKVICRSRVRLAKCGENNLKLDVEAGAIPERIFIRSKSDKNTDSDALPSVDVSKSPFRIIYGVQDEEDEQDEDDGSDNQTITGTTNIPITGDREPPTPQDGEHKPAVQSNGEQTDIPQVEAKSTPITSDTKEEEKRAVQPEIPLRSSRRSRKPVTRLEPTMKGQTYVVETVLDDDQDDASPFEATTVESKAYHSPMDDPPLKDMPEVETVDEDEDLAPHLRSKRKAGDPNPNDEPIDLQFMATPWPTEPDLPPDQLPGRTFLMPPEEDGSRYRAKIIAMIKDHKQDIVDHPELVKFRCLVNNKYEEVVAYNQIVDFIEQDDTWDGVWKFRRIIKHERVWKGHPRYMGSSWNLLLEWESGEISWQPLHRVDKNGIYDTDPVTVAIYAKENDLLDTPGWKLPGMKKIAKTQKRLIRRANQAKLHSFRTRPIYMYGFQVPRNHQQAMQLDEDNGNTLWRESELKELAQIDEYDTFLDKGKGYNPGKDYTHIRVHLVYAVKHDGRHKARLVAGGHLTETPVDSVYSSVVSLRGVRILTFIAELNESQVWCTDIGNAYLESYTKEKVYITAGPEFGDRAGHTLIIVKALYGLKSSGLRWHERFADVLRDMGFFPSKAEPDIWMRDKGDCYEYIAVYVDDLLIVSKDPQMIIGALTDEYNFKLKGTGPISFHLGCDFFRDEEGVLCYAPKKYIEKMLDNYKRIFGNYPRQVKSPLERGDHPELDTSDLLDIEWTKIYQSLIGGMQWVIQIGRWDVSTAVMTLSRFRAAPRQGHLDRVKRIHGYLSKMRHGVIRILTDEPDYSNIPHKEYDWFYTCYQGAEEHIPKDAPIPRGKPVKTTTYVDANLYHDLISGRSVTGILHMFNKTVVDTYSKLQTTVETATFGSEYAATRVATDQIVDLRTTLRYLGVPVKGSSMLFGDNESVVDTASIPHSKLHKRHNALAYHRTREAIAAGITQYYHVRSGKNPADILSKHWDMPSVWDSLRPLMFWRWGDTAILSPSDDEDEDNGSNANSSTTPR